MFFFFSAKIRACYGPLPSSKLGAVFLFLAKDYKKPLRTIKKPLRTIKKPPAVKDCKKTSKDYKKTLRTIKNAVPFGHHVVARRWPGGSEWCPAVQKKKQESVQKRIQNKFGSRQLCYCGSILCFLGSYLCFGFTRNSHGFSIAVETGRLVHNFLAQPYTRGASHSQLASHCQPLPAAASHSQTSDFIY